MAPNRYEVVLIYAKSRRKKNIAKGLTEIQAQNKVMSFPNSKTSMVIYQKMK